MNQLNDIRTDKGLSCAALGEMVNYDRSSVWKHCHAETIPAEAAIRYSRALDVPLEELRPDLVPDPAPTAIHEASNHGTP